MSTTCAWRKTCHLTYFESPERFYVRLNHTNPIRTVVTLHILKVLFYYRELHKIAQPRVTYSKRPPKENGTILRIACMFLDCTLSVLLVGMQFPFLFEAENNECIFIITLVSELALVR